MESIRLLFIKSGLLDKRFMAASALACAATVGLTAIVMSAAGKDVGAHAKLALLLAFSLCLLISLGARKYLFDRTTDVVEDAIHEIRMSICRQISRFELVNFEKLEKSTIHLALGKESQVLSSASSAIVKSLTDLLLLAATLLCVAFISPRAFKWIAAAAFVTALIYFRRTKYVKGTLKSASDKEEQLFGLVSGQLKGFKELRIHRDKAKDLLENDLVKAAKSVMDLIREAQHKINENIILLDTVIYALIGLTLFVLSQRTDEGQYSTPAVVALILFMSGPIDSLANSAKMIYRASDSADRIKAIQDMLAALPTIAPEAASGSAAPFERLQCEKLKFSYAAQPQRSGDGFELGPFDLTLQRGEIVFFIGGNGSGKSTLLRLLCGLYAPSSGRLLLNDRAIGTEGRAKYRSYFSIILQDFHLFPRLLGHPEIDLRRVHYLLNRLGLRGVTDVNKEGKVENLRLSTGQKKRLALLVAESEDRQVFIFDEWAADQDPVFRRFFYEEYLPEMRSRGKTILAATHDDKYFHTADRVFKLDRGQLSVYRTTSGPTP